MTIEELTRHYVKSFKNGPLSSETRIAYDNLRQYGASLGINLNKEFFKELLKRYQEKPQKYKDISPEELNKDILFQYQNYMQMLQEQPETQLMKKDTVTNKERRSSIEFR